MSPSRQAAIWGIGLLVFGFMLHLLGPVLLPFVAGLVVAYLFNPVVSRLDRWGLGRTFGTLLVLAVLALVVVVGIALLVPPIQAQLADLVRHLPDLVARAQRWIMELAAQFSYQLGEEQMEQLKSAAGSVAGDAAKMLGGLLGGLWSGGLALLQLVSLVLIAPVVAFFVLRDWDRTVARVDGWLPREHAPVIRRLASEANAVISGYMRGAALVCLILAVFYAAGLSLIGLDFALVIGIVSGLISFIPFVGAAVGFIASVGVALVQFDDVTWVVVTAAVFLAGQALEGNFLTPKLVGDRIGLHPVWVIFALLAGGLMFGFVGVLLAVPVAAVVGVLARFALARYLESALYRGPDAGNGAGGDGAGGDARP